MARASPPFGRPRRRRHEGERQTHPTVADPAALIVSGYVTVNGVIVTMCRQRYASPVTALLVSRKTLAGDRG